MYKLFTRDEKWNFTTRFGGYVTYIDQAKGLSAMAKLVYSHLLTELNRLFNSNTIKEDNVGLYVELARTVIGGKIGKCGHTIAKYIRELKRYGLLVDRRMGVNLCNRIYLKYPFNAARYEKGQKNKVDSPASKNPPQENTLINKAKDIISQGTDECIELSAINQMLNLCNDNLDTLKSAVEYCYGKTTKTNYTNMLINTIRNKWYEKKAITKDVVEIKHKSTPSKVKAHNSMDTHGFDYEALEEMQSLRVSLLAGTITQEEYDEKISKFNITK